jgi:uncharacterized DUF497 family protein
LTQKPSPSGGGGSLAFLSSTPLEKSEFLGVHKCVLISYDPGKRAITLAKRGLDFDDAPKVFAGPTLTLPDEREDYGEDRYQTIGLLDDEVVMVVWTPRGEDRRVISMRKCSAREKALFQARSV